MKISKYTSQILKLLVLSLLIISCVEENHSAHKHNENNAPHSVTDDHGHDHPSDDHSGNGHNSPANDPDHDDHEEGLHLTKEQIEAVELQFGHFKEIKLNDFIKATGTLGLPPNAFATVTAKTAGIITGNKKYVEGNVIKKGAVIAYLEDPAIIQFQQEYLEAKAMLTLKRHDLERQKTLTSAGAGVSKNEQTAQAEVDILEAKTNGLGKQLNYLGIATENLTANNITQRIAIYSPMNGFISSINIHQGMYAQPGIPLMEIIEDDHIHLELDIFEKDIANIKVGQQISYSVPALDSEVYSGEISVIGKEFDTHAKTIRIHGHLEGNQPPFIKDLFVNAKIWMNDETAIALPEEAVVQEGLDYFIYAANYKPYADETFFEKYQVIPGKADNGFISLKLIDTLPEGMQIVTKGAYFVFSQSIVGEIEHSH